MEDKQKLQSKSSLKTTKDDFSNKEKKEVRYGKAITYQVDGDSEPSVLLHETDKKIIGEKDLSEGREAKEAARKQLEDDAERIKEEHRLMNEWKAKQAAKDEADAKKSHVAKIPTTIEDVDESNYSSSYQSSGQKVVVTKTGE